jgi:uncharacterized membrane protein
MTMAERGGVRRTPGAPGTEPPGAMGRGAILAAALFVLASLAIALVALAQVGITATVPVHWGVDGQPDGYGSAWLSLLVVPVMQVGLVALLAVIPRFEPRRANLARSRRSYEIVVVGVAALFTLVQAAIAIATLGGEIDFSRIIVGGVGVFFIAIGLAMPGFRPNYMAGIRTPWTLTSDLSWRKTHVLGGRLFVLVGALIVVVSPFLNVGALTAVMLVGLLGAVAIMVVYSYRVWKTDPDKRVV